MLLVHVIVVVFPEISGLKNAEDMLVMEMVNIWCGSLRLPYKVLQCPSINQKVMLDCFFHFIDIAQAVKI